MDLRTSCVLIALVISGCLATSVFEDAHLSKYFDHTDGRIVGGSVAPPGSAPYMVALTSGFLIRSFFCGGSLVSSRSVLTAAHCIEAVFSFGSLSSTARGTVGTNTWNLGGTTYNFARNVSHPHYVRATIKNDIGFLITTTDVVTSDLISPVPLNFAFVPAGVTSRVNGWGRIVAGGSISSQLLELYATVIDGAVCEFEVDLHGQSLPANQRPPPIEPAIEICTYHSRGHGTCNGDSGSALIRPDTGEQIGIVSWGFPCALGLPDMFVRISGFRDWIEANIV